MRFLSCLSIAVVAVGSFASASPGDGADLTAYIESIRASKMSENAQSALVTVAGIACGATILKYIEDKESGRYWPSYQSAVCPNPTADAPELTRWKTIKVDESSALAQKLQPFADADRSGFVTTEEGMNFRFLIEYGYMAKQVMEEHEGSYDSIARAAGTDASAAEKRAQEYSALAKRISEAGIQGLPQLAASKN